MNNDNIIQTEKQNESQINNKKYNNQKLNLNHSNITRILQNQRNFINFLFQAEENILLSNFNKSTSLTINNINILFNKNIENKLINDQIKYIQIADDFIDKKINGKMNIDYGRNYQFVKILNNMNENIKNDRINNYNKNFINNRKYNNENSRSDSPADSKKRVQLNSSSFSTSIGGKNSNINSSRNNSNEFNNKQVNQLKTFKIGKKEDFTITVNNSIQNDETIIYNTSQSKFSRAESPTSIRTFNTGSTKMFENSNGKDRLSNNKYIQINNNVIFKNIKGRNSPQQKINYNILLSPNESPRNNHRNRNKKIYQKEDDKNIKNTNNNIIYSKIELNKKIKKIKLKFEKDGINQRSKSPIQVEYNIDNKFKMPVNVDSLPLSDDENKSFKHNKINYSNLDMNPKSIIKNDFKNNEDINNRTYINQMKNKKKNIIKLNPLNIIENNLLNVNNSNNNRCITTENENYNNKKEKQNIRKSPTSFKNNHIIYKGIKKKLSNNNNIVKNINLNNNKSKMIKIDYKNKNENINNNDKIINNNPNKNNKDKNNDNKIIFINSRKNNAKIIKTNNDLIKINNKKENLPIKNKDIDIKNNYKSKYNPKGINNNDQIISIQKKENIKENNNNNIKINTKKKKKPKKKIFTLDLSEEDKNINNIDKNNNSEHSENISDKSLSDDNKPEFYNYNEINENNNNNKKSHLDNYKKDNLNQIYCSFGAKNTQQNKIDYNVKEINENIIYNDNNIKNKDNNVENKEIKNEEEIENMEIKVLKELREKLKKRNEKEMENKINNNKKSNELIDNNIKNNNKDNNNREEIYKSNDLERIIQAHKNDENKKPIIKPYPNFNHIFNNIEDNLNIEEEEKNKYLLYYDYEKNNDLNNSSIKDDNNYYKALDNDCRKESYHSFYENNFSFQRNDTGYFGEKNNERNSEYNNYNNYINKNIENRESKYYQDENENNKKNKGKEDLLKFSFKINSEVNESEFNDINFLE